MIYPTILLLVLTVLIAASSGWFGTSRQIWRPLAIASWSLMSVGLAVQLLRRPALYSVAHSILMGLPAAGAFCMVASYFAPSEQFEIGFRIAAVVLIVLTIPLYVLAWLRQRARRSTE